MIKGPFLKLSKFSSGRSFKPLIKTVQPLPDGAQTNGQAVVEQSGEGIKGIPSGTISTPTAEEHNAFPRGRW